MSLSALAQQGQSMMFRHSGQPLVMSWRSTQVRTTGVVFHDVDPVRFLEQGKAKPACIVAVGSAAGCILNTEWFITVDGITRPVLEVINDNSGVYTVHLGDAHSC